MDREQCAPRGLLSADDSIVLLIDLQEPFLKKLEPEESARVVDHCRFIVEVAQRFDIPVVTTVEQPQKNGGTVAGLRACFESPLVEWDKKSFGAMGQDNIRDHVLAQHRRTALVIGLETDVCVLQTAVGLRELGFRSVVVEDAVGAPEPDHRYGLGRMADLGIEKAHAKGIFYEWSRTLERLSDIKGKGIIKNPMRSTL